MLEHPYKGFYENNFCDLTLEKKYLCHRKRQDDWNRIYEQVRIELYLISVNYIIKIRVLKSKTMRNNSTRNKFLRTKRTCEPLLNFLIFVNHKRTLNSFFLLNVRCI